MVPHTYIVTACPVNSFGRTGEQEPPDDYSLTFFASVFSICVWDAHDSFQMIKRLSGIYLSSPNDCSVLLHVQVFSMSMMVAA